MSISNQLVPVQQNTDYRKLSKTVATSQWPVPEPDASSTVAVNCNTHLCMRYQWIFRSTCNNDLK